jgi:hypothetical protein
VYWVKFNHQIRESVISVIQVITVFTQENSWQLNLQRKQAKKILLSVILVQKVLYAEGVIVSRLSKLVAICTNH